jgi:hypothetical protein
MLPPARAIKEMEAKGGTRRARAAVLAAAEKHTNWHARAMQHHLLHPASTPHLGRSTESASSWTASRIRTSPLLGGPGSPWDGEENTRTEEGGEMLSQVRGGGGAHWTTTHPAAVQERSLVEALLHDLERLHAELDWVDGLVREARVEHLQVARRGESEKAGKVKRGLERALCHLTAPTAHSTPQTSPTQPAASTFPPQPFSTTLPPLIPVPSSSLRAPCRGQ